MHTRVWTDLHELNHQRGRSANRRSTHQGQPAAASLQSTADALAELEADGWLILHDLQRPGRRFASIDHIAVGPGGVVVIDTKDWAGEVDVVGGVLRQNGARRDRECDLAAASAAAVTAWLEPAQRTAVMSLIALVGQPTPLRQPTATAVYGVADLALTLRALPVRLRTGRSGPWPTCCAGPWPTARSRCS